MLRLQTHSVLFGWSQSNYYKSSVGLLLLLLTTLHTYSPLSLCACNVHTPDNQTSDSHSIFTAVQRVRHGYTMLMLMFLLGRWPKLHHPTPTQPSQSLAKPSSAGARVVIIIAFLYISISLYLYLYIQSCPLLNISYNSAKSSLIELKFGMWPQLSLRWQQMTANNSKWQQMMANDSKWQQLTANAKSSLIELKFCMWPQLSLRWQQITSNARKWQQMAANAKSSSIELKFCMWPQLNLRWQQMTAI